MDMEFQVGDRVQMIRVYNKDNPEMGPEVGTYGVIKFIKGSGFSILVEWEKRFPGGHMGNGECASGRGYWVQESHIALADDDTKFSFDDGELNELLS